MIFSDLLIYPPNPIVLLGSKTWPIELLVAVHRRQSLVVGNHHDRLGWTKVWRRSSWSDWGHTVCSLSEELTIKIIKPPTVNPNEHNEPWSFEHFETPQHRPRKNSYMIQKKLHQTPSYPFLEKPASCASCLHDATWKADADEHSFLQSPTSCCSYLDI